MQKYLYEFIYVGYTILIHRLGINAMEVKTDKLQFFLL